MELHMHSHHFARRTPDWRAAIIGGCVAGVVFLVLELLAMWVMGQSPWGPPRMIAAIALGQGILAQPAAFDLGIVMVALIVHFALSIIFGVSVLFVLNLAVCFDFSFTNKHLQIFDSAGPHPFDAKSGAFIRPRAWPASA
ncbi:hypothetical protein [Paraburkholderia franconis]|uniref:hypothetical protein n=1 Tax=Paraburkholderia franconis TaxID=2654983 RepID=UPI00187B251A|nr:hypothetical protein [Paraburkholderia franconis]